MKMNLTPDKADVVKFLQNSKFGKIKYDRSPTITSYRQILPCVRVVPISKRDSSEADHNDFLTKPMRKDSLRNINKANEKNNISRVSLNGSTLEDSRSFQLDSSSLDISSVKDCSIDSNSSSSQKQTSQTSLVINSSAKSEREIAKLTEDSLRVLVEKETKKNAYLTALKDLEKSLEKNQSIKLEKINITNSVDETHKEDVWEKKRKQDLQTILDNFRNIKISIPESKIEIPKPVIVEEVNVQTPETPQVVPQTSQIVPETIQNVPGTSQVSQTVSLGDPRTKPQLQEQASSQVENIPTPPTIVEPKKSETIPFSTPRASSQISETIPAVSNLFGNNSGLGSFSNSNQTVNSFISQKNTQESASRVEDDNNQSTSEVAFSFASIASNEYEDTTAPIPPVIQIKTLSLKDYADVPAEAIYDYYIYQRYILFNKAKQFEEANNEKAKSIKKCFSVFNKLTETNQGDILNCLLRIYIQKQCSDGNKVIPISEEDSSFEFTVFRGCYAALNIMVSQKFTLVLYNLAAIISVLCSKIPLFRDCFLGFLYKQCPYAIPYFPIRKTNESKDNFTKRCGNLRNMSDVDFQIFIQKNMKLFGAILQMNIPDKYNSLNMFYAWNYIQRFLKSIGQMKNSKLPISYCIILEGFLSTTSHKLFELYNRRFTELYELMKINFISQIQTIESNKSDTNQQAYHLLMNFINKVDKVVNKQSRNIDLRDFNIPDKFFNDYFK